MTQQNAAMVEQMAASSQQLNGQIESVLNSLRLFRLSGRDTALADVDAVQLRRQARAAAPAVPAAPARPAAATADDAAWATF